jgi:hypothetical protein
MRKTIESMKTKYFIAAILAAHLAVGTTAANAQLVEGTYSIMESCLEVDATSGKGKGLYSDEATIAVSGNTVSMLYGNGVGQGNKLVGTLIPNVLKPTEGLLTLTSCGTTAPFSGYNYIYSLLVKGLGTDSIKMGGVEIESFSTGAGNCKVKLKLVSPSDTTLQACP